MATNYDKPLSFPSFSPLHLFGRFYREENDGSWNEKGCVLCFLSAMDLLVFFLILIIGGAIDNLTSSFCISSDTSVLCFWSRFWSCFLKAEFQNSLNPVQWSDRKSNSLWAKFFYDLFVKCVIHFTVVSMDYHLFIFLGLVTLAQRDYSLTRSSLRQVPPQNVNWLQKAAKRFWKRLEKTGNCISVAETWA